MSAVKSYLIVFLRYKATSVTVCVIQFELMELQVNQTTEVLQAAEASVEQQCADLIMHLEAENTALEDKHKHQQIQNADLSNQLMRLQSENERLQQEVRALHGPSQYCMVLVSTAWS